MSKIKKLKLFKSEDLLFYSQNKVNNNSIYTKIWKTQGDIREVDPLNINET